MSIDRYLNPFERPNKAHLVRGKGGVAGEVSDLRKDCSSAFSRVATETDTTAVGLSPVADLTALALVNATDVVEGSVVFVNSVDDLYVLDTTDTHTPDGVTVIAALGGGYWLARQYGRWDDMLGSVVEGNASGSLTEEDFRDTAFRMYFMRRDQDDELNFSFQFSHRWRHDLTVRPHIHVVVMSDPAVKEVAYFSGYYAWSREGNAAIPPLSGWTTFNATMDVDPGDIYKQKLAILGEITPPSWARGSSVLLLHVTREGTNILDTYTTSKDHGTAAANLGVLSSDVHYRINSPGSISEVPV